MLHSCKTHYLVGLVKINEDLKNNAKMAENACTSCGALLSPILYLFMQKERTCSLEILKEPLTYLYLSSGWIPLATLRGNALTCSNNKKYVNKIWT